MGLLGGEQDEGFIEVDVTSLPERQHYYLEVSPVSVYAFTGIPQFNPWSLNVYHSVGDGLVTTADRGQGEFLSRVALTEPGAGWYSPNDWGGYWGDSYVDITAVVSAARIAGNQFIALRYGATMDPWTPTFRGLLRAPAVLATDFTVPAPAAAPLLALAGLTARSRRRR
jgi:MYXO-CTERM domain-containing protein